MERTFTKLRYKLNLISYILALIVALVIPSSKVFAQSTQLYLLPLGQSVAVGSNVVVSIMVDVDDSSIDSSNVNSVQSNFSFSTANFSFVSITPGSAFGYFPAIVNNGSIQFTAGTLGGGTSGIQTVADITLHAIKPGTSSLSLSPILCGSGNYTINCSAAYDSTTSENLLSSVLSTSYTVTPLPPSTPQTNSSTNNGGLGGAIKRLILVVNAIEKANNPASAVDALKLPAPEISDIAVSDVAPTSATINWVTNIPSTSEVDYGLSRNLGQIVSKKDLTLVHQIKIPYGSLNQGTIYYFSVSSTSSIGASNTSPIQKLISGGYYVSIKIVDKDNNPIIGAKVVIDGQVEVTNSRGIAIFKNLPVGHQSVQITSSKKVSKQSINIIKIKTNSSPESKQSFILVANFNKSSNLGVYIYIVLSIVALVSGYLVVSKIMRAKTTRKIQDIDFHTPNKIIGKKVKSKKLFDKGGSRYKADEPGRIYEPEDQEPSKPK